MRSCAALAVTLALPAAEATWAQTFEDAISVVEVEVPVQVLVDGRPILGLTRDNFELLVDGEPRELSFFEAIELHGVAGPVAVTPGDQTSATETPASGEAPTTVAAEAPGAARTALPMPAAARSGRHYVLLFDFAFSGRRSLLRAVTGARRMVQTQSHPGDRLSVALFAEAVGARILVPFTEDRAAVELGLEIVEALASARPRPALERLEALDAWWAGSFDRGSLPRPLLADLGATAGTLIQPLANPPEPAGIGLPIAVGDGRRDGTSQRYRVGRLTSIVAVRTRSLSAVRVLGRSLGSLVTLLRDVPEPKHVFYLSQGLGGLFNSEPTPVLHHLKPMLDAFAETGWTLQAIDIGGLQAVSTAGAQNNSLFYLANETGGELFENYNRIDTATAKVLDRTRATYLLAFHAQDLAADGERYDIEVRLTPPIDGARLLHRPFFRAPRPASDRLPVERRMDAADLALGGERLDELGVKVLPVVLPGGAGARIPVFVEVRADGLDAGRKDQKRVHLDIHGFALDETGDVRAGFSRALRFYLDGARVVALEDEIALPAGSHELRLLAWDLKSGRRQLSHVPVVVGDGSPGLLSGPFLLATDRARRRAPPETVEPGDALALFRLGGVLEAPDLAPAIGPSRSQRFLLLVPRSPRAAGARLRVAVVATGGGPLLKGVGFERIEDGTDGTARFAGRLETAGLDPGSYLLEASLEDRSGTIAVSATRFEVRDATPATADSPGVTGEPR